MKPRWFLILLLLVIALPALAIPRIHLRGISVGAGYSHFSGPYYPGFYPPYYAGYYPGAWPGYSRYYGWDPFWATPLAYGPPLGYSVHSADKGEVHLKDAAPQSEVYIDGAYAGLIKDLHTVWLAPGAYNVEVRTPNREPVQKKIYVLTGKTLNVRMAEVKP
jgi:hypothetical protein